MRQSHLSSLAVGCLWGKPGDQVAHQSARYPPFYHLLWQFTGVIKKKQEQKKAKRNELFRTWWPLISYVLACFFNLFVACSEFMWGRLYSAVTVVNFDMDFWLAWPEKWRGYPYAALSELQMSNKANGKSSRSWKKKLVFKPHEYVKWLIRLWEALAANVSEYLVSESAMLEWALSAACVFFFFLFFSISVSANFHGIVGWNNK